ncbi:MAG: DUF2442 domain-containing protein [Chloroflexi bacterium]|nr:DUF2442 domain-containing protein [Chloroflexota bacterium]MBI3733372.1 DUF2442 domain-containing protein [Chloroflexota bacterium]
MHFVKDATYLERYKLAVTFEDGQRRVVDLERHLEGEIFEPLRDIDYFQSFRVDPDLDTIAWDNGADISPNFLYDIGVSSTDQSALFTKSKSGVKLFTDFRQRLIIDRYDPILVKMRQPKLDRLHSENSEDVFTWNVFRSLRQIDPNVWFPRLFEQCFGYQFQVPVQEFAMELWPSLSPPKTLPWIEGKSEIDVRIETESFVWFIEAKLKSDVSPKVTHNRNRDQILRNLDVGSCYAKPRDFYFALLILDRTYTPHGLALLEDYAKHPDKVLNGLPHRSNQLANIKGIGQFTWFDIAAILAKSAVNPDEQHFATNLLNWLKQNGVTW